MPYAVKEEGLSKVILFGERSLRRTLSEYVEHFHTERNYQGKGNILLFPRDTDRGREGPVQGRERLGGLLYIRWKQFANDVRGPLSNVRFFKASHKLEFSILVMMNPSGSRWTSNRILSPGVNAVSAARSLTRKVMVIDSM